MIEVDVLLATCVHIMKPHPILKWFNVEPQFFYSGATGDAELNGLYDDLRRFHDRTLKDLRNFVEQKIYGKKRVHVLVDETYLSLYMAYWASRHAEDKIEVTFLVPEKEIGGTSPWAEMHPLLLSQFVIRTIERADVSFTDQAHLESFAQRYVRVPHVYSIIGDAVEEEVAA